MKLINDVLSSPTKTAVVFGGAAAASHLFFALDMVVTGGIGAVGLVLVWRAHSNKS